MSIIYPVVPIAPGVPPVSRQTQVIIAGAILMVEDAVAALISAPVRWGIFLDGEIVLEADSAVAVDYRDEWHIPTYPIEKGNFASYNKVKIPYDIRVILTKGGSESERSSFLQALKQVAGSLELYDVVTPEIIYTNANIVRYEYRRHAQNGVSLLTPTIILQQVRDTATSAFSRTAEPTGAPQSNNGVVQPTSVPGVPPTTPAANSAAPLDIDNLPGFSKPLVNYSVLGFQ